MMKEHYKDYLRVAVIAYDNELHFYEQCGFVKMMKASTDMGIYLKYYICDILFTVAFLNFMIQMVSDLKVPCLRESRMSPMFLL